MDKSTNIIDFTFLDTDEKRYLKTVLIILNRPILPQMYLDLKSKIDLIICADGAANRMYDDLGRDK
jgi:hypothetical protein